MVDWKTASQGKSKTGGGEMITIAVFVALGILGVILIKRIIGGIVGITVFVVALFLSVFALDTFTPLDLRSYVPMAWYDKSVSEPEETAKELKDKAYNKGEGAIHSIADAGAEADYKYGTETEKQKAERLQKEKELAEYKAKLKEETGKDGVEVGVGVADTSVSGYGEETPKTEQVVEKEETKKGKQTINYRDVDNYVKKHTDIPKLDQEIMRAIKPNLTIDMEGDSYRIWNDRKNLEVFYIEKLEKKG